MAILGVLFDKDGTFVDFDATYGPATHAVIHRLANGDMRIMQRQADALQFLLETQRFLPASPLIAGSTLDYGAPWAKALGRTDLAALAAQIDALLAEAALSALTPLGDPARLMPNLRAAGFRLGVATNDSEASARRQIEALGLQEEFVFVAGYDSGHSQKPAPGMALAFARHIEASPAQIAMVGDSVHDLCCARAAGAKAVGVLTGPANAEQLAPYADALLKSIAELPAWLASA